MTLLIHLLTVYSSSPQNTIYTQVIFLPRYFMRFILFSYTSIKNPYDTLVLVRIEIIPSIIIHAFDFHALSIHLEAE